MKVKPFFKLKSKFELKKNKVVYKKQNIINKFLIMSTLMVLVISILIYSRYRFNMKFQSEIKEKNKALTKAFTEIELMSRTDHLTTLSNRRDIIQRMQTEKDRLQRSKNCFALIMIDIDNFKDVNDRYSHDVGDKVLNIMAIFLQSELNEEDIGIRYKGDEYAAILLNTSKTQAIKRADEIRKIFNEMDLSGVIGSDEIRITVSIGIALYPSETDQSKELVTMAHHKMLRARETGGNTINI